MSRLAAGLIVRLAARLLPPPMRDWGRAMEAELRMIDRPGSAFLFALGCLGCALRQRMLRGPFGWETAMNFRKDLKDRPQRLAALCATASIGLGLAYLAAAGAPASYLAVNAAALAIGLLAIGLLAMAGGTKEAVKGVLCVALAVALLLASLWGVSADGVTRWVSAGGLMLQPALLLIPVLAVRFARSGDGLSTLAMLIAAVALALQPDRALAGALAAGMTALALLRPERNILLVSAAALAGLVATMIRPDPSPAAPFVDQILYSSFAVHPLAGMAVLAGAVLMIVPAIVGHRRDAMNREVYAVFGTIWFALVAAAALGNYPTPLVGYGGSAIVGYFVSLICLPLRVGSAPVSRGEVAARPDAENPKSALRAGLSFSL